VTRAGKLDKHFFATGRRKSARGLIPEIKVFFTGINSAELTMPKTIICAGHIWWSVQIEDLADVK